MAASSWGPRCPCPARLSQHGDPEHVMGMKTAASADAMQHAANYWQREGANWEMIHIFVYTHAIWVGEGTCQAYQATPATRSLCASGTRRQDSKWMTAFFFHVWPWGPV